MLHFRPEILIGMPGASKSYWAQKRAAYTGKTAVDLDREIERQTGKTIPEIFAEDGEAAFRQAESRALETILAGGKDFVLATGGGTPCFGENMARMLAAGKVIYLEAPVTLLAARIQKAENARPLLQQLPPNLLIEKLEEMLVQRAPFYRQAHFTVSVQDLDNATFEGL